MRMNRRTNAVGIGMIAALVATAQAGGASGSGLVVLNASSNGALTMNGNASIEIPTKVVYVNSASASAVQTVGKAVIDAPALYVVGGTSFGGNSGCTGSVITGAPGIYDPLMHLAIPNADGMESHGTVNIKKSSEPVTLTPGSYPSGLKITGNASVVFSPGVYIIGGTGLVITSGDVVGEGVCLIIASGSCELAGSSSLTLSPIGSGHLANIVLAQPSSNTSEMRLAGGSEFKVTGTIYAPKARLSLVGNSQIEGTGPQMGDLVIADRVSLSGTASIRIGREHLPQVSLPSMPLYD